MSKKGIIFDIQSYAIYDGPGIRTAIYFKGCPLKCYWCHNPESQMLTPQLMGDKLVGKEMSVSEIINQVMKDHLFFVNSGGGVTITGGEPTLQSDFLLELLKELKNKNIHVALETCGYFSQELLDQLCLYVDLFLYDLKHINNESHRQGTGVDNQIILDNFKIIHQKRGNQSLIARIPMIPGYNNEDSSLNEFQHFFQSIHFTGEVHILPFHSFGFDKYNKLGRTQPMIPKIENKCEYDKYAHLGIVHGR